MTKITEPRRLVYYFKGCQEEAADEMKHKGGRNGTKEFRGSISRDICYRKYITAADRISASNNACACVRECKFVETGFRGKLLPLKSLMLLRLSKLYLATLCCVAVCDLSCTSFESSEGPIRPHLELNYTGEFGIQNGGNALDLNL